MRTLDKVLGTLYGQAIGDAMGMPTELWSKTQIKQNFPQPLTDFAAGPANNEIAKYFKRGEYTDDTNQALVIIESLIETNWQPDTQNIVQHLLRWADEVDAWENNILGPSSKAALTLAKAGKSTTDVTKEALTNGAAMRIAPIGALFEPEQLDELVELVVAITKVTHSSDVSYSGACLIAGAVCAAMADCSWQDIISYALRANNLGFQKGFPTWAAKTSARVKLGLDLADKFANQPQDFMNAIYDVVGTGTMISESVPAAFVIACYCQDVTKCALMCANLGGDTDTIGAMATAICGAKQGYSHLDKNWCELIDLQNPKHDLQKIARTMMTFGATN